MRLSRPAVLVAAALRRRAAFHADRFLLELTREPLKAHPGAFILGERGKLAAMARAVAQFG